MKRTITLRFLLSLCVMTLVSAFSGGNLALAEEVEEYADFTAITNAFNLENYQNLVVSDDGWQDKDYTSNSNILKLTVSLNGVSSIPCTNGSYVKINKGNAFTISMADGKSIIKSIEINHSRASSVLTSGTNGSISTNNTKVVWTPNDGISTSTVKFETTNTQARITGIKVTYEAASVATKQDVTLDMSAAATIDLLDSYQATASVVVPDGGAAAATGKISYSVEPASGDFIFDATTGLFTAGKTEGYYTIKATFEGDENYNMAEASTTVTVSSRVWALKNYVQVTDASQVIDGAQYLLVYDDGEDLNVMSTFDNSSYEATNAPFSCAFYKNGNLINVSAEYSGAPFVLEAVGDNKYALKTSQGYWQCYVDNYSGKTSYGLMISETSASQAAQWTITIEDGKARIVNVYDSTLELCCYVSTWSKSYSSFQARPNNGYALTLYAKCADMNFNKLANGYATYAIGSAYQMPAGVKGYVVKGLNDSNEKLVKEEAFSAGSLVPALTPLLVYAENLEGEDKTYYPILLQKEVGDYTGDNYLEYKRTAENMTAPKQGESVYYYKLTMKVDSENPENNKPLKPLGFYWGAANGEAFMLNSHSSAYLVLPQSLFGNGSQASALLFDEAGQATGIQLTPTTENNTQAVYNLQGVRVSGKLAKGIYIVNGKKVYVK